MARILLAALAVLLLGSWDWEPRVLGPYRVAINQPADLMGDPETRPCCWGLSAAQYVPYVFHPPTGYRVRVLRLDGNFYAFARGVYLSGQHAGISWGATTSAPSGSSRMPLGADNCFLYLAYGISNGEVNQPFSQDVAANGLLAADNAFSLVSAVFLNDQAVSIHMETTGTMTYQFERVN